MAEANFHQEITSLRAQLDAVTTNSPSQVSCSWTGVTIHSKPAVPRCRCPLHARLYA